MSTTSSHYVALNSIRTKSEWSGVLAYNELTMNVEALKPTPWGHVGGWTDEQDILATAWFHKQNIRIGRDAASGIILVKARENSYNPLREWLKGLKWDGQPRAFNWLTQYLGVPDSPYTRAVGEKWLISAVARVFHPGCKADCSLILEGPQGIGKSRALRTLAGSYFTDEIADFGSKDAAMQMRGVWIIELSELDTLNRSEVGRIKSFMSRSTDRFRLPYGRHVIESPRQCVFAGTVNHSNYLRDESGNRRFWPVACQSIKIHALEHDRDQLWAEAVALLRAGNTWWLDTPEIIRAAESEQAERYDSDPWQDKIAAHLRSQSETTIDDLLEYCILKQPGEWTQGDKNRLARCLRVLGWTKTRVWDTVDTRMYCYRCPEDWNPSGPPMIGGVRVVTIDSHRASDRHDNPAIEMTGA